MAIKYVLTKTVAELDKLQLKAVKSVQSARVAIQIASVATIHHAYEHGDWTYAEKLVVALGNTVNGKALVEWFKVYGGLKTDDKGFTGWSGAEYIKEHFSDAKAVMWWDLKVVSPFKGYSLEDALLKVIKDHDKAAKAMEGMSDEDKDKVNMAVNDSTIQSVVRLCNFKAIIENEVANG